MKLASNSDYGVGRKIGSIASLEDRLIAAHRIDHYPFLIVATTNVAAVLTDWWRTVYYLTGIASLAMLAVAGGAFLLIRQFKNQVFVERSRAERVEAEYRREQGRRLDAALENMSQGLVMFDPAARLVICNDQYRKIYNLSPEMAKPGCSIVDLLKHRVVSRTYSGDPEEYVSGLMAKIAQGAIVKDEVETGDGRIISIVTQPMVGGGWVATHEDITEATRQEASFRLLFQSNPVPMWVYDVKSLRFLAVNAAAVTHYGYSAEQFLTMTVMDIRPPEERERITKFLQVAGEEHDGEQSWQHQKSDKTIIEVVIYSRALSYEGHSAALVASIDITDRKRGEDELRRTKRFIDAVIEHVPLPIIVKDVSGLETDARGSRFTFFNRAYEELTGESRSQLIGKTAHQVFPKERADLIVQSDNETVQSDQVVLTSEHPIVTLHNGTRLVVAKKTIIRDENEKPRYLLTVVDDVTERRQSEARIAHMAHYDTLTDLPNRVTFNETMNSALERATLTGQQFTILSVDLDRFKEINDTHGHLVGDALLREVAQRLRVAAGETFLARIGGDEFALIVTDGPQPAIASALAKCLLSAFGNDIEVEGKQLKLGVCIGGALYPTDGADAKTLMVNADAALYRAKAEARGSVQFYQPEMGVRLREHHALQNDLRLAVDRSELILHYQPQVRMTGEFNGFEALVRWQSPNRGMVSPGTFIPVAEESSLIFPIGEWVLREACLEAASWSQPLSVAVNISPVQFRHGDLPSLVHSILLETGLAPARLELEITEGVFIEDFSRAVSILRRLKSLGVKIALDDFGTGYSSLSYLHSFTFDKIKIDRAFIGDLEHNRHSIAITRAVIGLGHSLDVPVLAEGVETDAQHAFLVQEGCDEVQGYLTGRPLPIGDYAKLVGRQAIVQKNYAIAG